MRGSRGGLLATLICCVLSVGCIDAMKEVDKHFADAGLSRLAAPRTGLEPGALFVRGSGGFVYADNMMDYPMLPGAVQLTLVTGDGTSDYDAILSGYKGTRSMGPEVALSVLQKTMPVKLEGKLKFTSDVKIDLVSARVRRLKIPGLQSFLNSTESRPFRDYVRKTLQSGGQVFLAYETWRTDKLHIVAEGGREISAGLDAQIHEIDGSGDVKFSYQRKSTNTIEIAGTTPYVFAVRTAQLSAGPSSDAVQIDITKVVKPKAGGLKALGDDSDYSTPMLDGYAAVTVVPKQ